MDKELLKKRVAENIAFYRKRNGLTQAELAEKLNYSDKAISKWERGDGLPDLVVLNEMADIFGININDFTVTGKRRRYTIIKRNKILVSLASVCLVWLVASLVFVMLSLIAPEYQFSYMAFVYAVPISSVVLLILSCIWKYKYVIFGAYSVLVWSTLFAIHLTITLSHSWYLFIVGIPLQALGIFWLFKKDRKKD
jgi:transcriptional regulator with XRE-family HTH domain